MKRSIAFLNRFTLVGIFFFGVGLSPAMALRLHPDSACAAATMAPDRQIIPGVPLPGNQFQLQACMTCCLARNPNTATVCQDICSGDRSPYYDEDSVESTDGGTFVPSLGPVDGIIDRGNWDKWIPNALVPDMMTDL